MSWKNDQVSQKDTEMIMKLAREALSVKGDYAEFGCYKGDTSLLLAEILQDCKVSSAEFVSFGGKPVEKVAKKLWIYDSFEGLPEKSEKDESVLGEQFKRGQLAVTKREVKERFLRAGLSVPIIKKGWFSDLAENDLPDRIAFSFLDGDFYESIRDSLRLVIPRMTRGGILVVHDYNNAALPGVRKAVEESSLENNNSFRVVLL